MSEIRPNPEQFKQLAQSPETGVVAMVNLLKFKDAAHGEAGPGEQAYRRSGEATVAMVAVGSSGKG